METLISQDYEFKKYSQMYGKFLVEIHESYPGVEVSDISAHYPYKDQHTIFIHVAVPTTLAVILKLTFGAHLRDRPPPKPKPDISKDKENYKTSIIQESYYRSMRERRILEEEKRYRAKEMYMHDYLTILKTRSIEDVYNEAKMDKIYIDLKNLSELKIRDDEK